MTPLPREDGNRNSCSCSGAVAQSAVFRWNRQKPKTSKSAPNVTTGILSLVDSPPIFALPSRQGFYYVETKTSLLMLILTYYQEEAKVCYCLKDSRDYPQVR
jgi:hypothetical protein